MSTLKRRVPFGRSDRLHVAHHELDNGLTVLVLADRSAPVVAYLLASIAVGVNVYLMATQFHALQNAVAASLVLSTLGSAITTPLLLALLS